MYCVINNPVLTAAVQLLFGDWVGSDCTESLWYLFPLLVGWKIGGNDENRKEIKKKCWLLALQFNSNVAEKDSFNLNYYRASIILFHRERQFYLSKRKKY